MSKVLVGSRDERIEMTVAGADQLPPLRPIFVRPAVRLDPYARPINWRKVVIGVGCLVGLSLFFCLLAVLIP